MDKNRPSSENDLVDLYLSGLAVFVTSKRGRPQILSAVVENAGAFGIFNLLDNAVTHMWLGDIRQLLPSNVSTSLWIQNLLEYYR
jgi:hypothetical protein